VQVTAGAVEGDLAGAARRRKLRLDPRQPHLGAALRAGGRIGQTVSFGRAQRIRPFGGRAGKYRHEQLLNATVRSATCGFYRKASAIDEPPQRYLLHELLLQLHNTYDLSIYTLITTFLRVVTFAPSEYGTEPTPPEFFGLNE
jgi:hypothetical protein